MSLNNLNIFELKHQNRYAQLVEASQSPEAQEIEPSQLEGSENLLQDTSSISATKPTSGGAEDADDGTKKLPQTPSVSIDIESLRSDSAEKQPPPITHENYTTTNYDYDDDDKCSSNKLMNHDDEESKKNRATNAPADHGGSAATGGGAKLQASSPRKASQCSSQVSSSFVSTASASTTTSGRGTITNQSNLTRTISRSMLEFDTSAKLDKFEVSWRNLSFSYQRSLLAGLKRTKPNHVLRDISGGFKSNQLIAVIGPSGCGKTTLLQFLAGNNPSHKDKLRISGLNEPKVAFIGQDDCLLPGLTARQTLVYASQLQNTTTDFDHTEHVKSIIQELGLTECADRSVTKLSGGQIKRVTIAQELLYPTNLLILDEVTSGLDASTSYSIVKLLKQLVSDNEYQMSIVMSIHQPSARLFAVFDQVYVMSDGNCLYEGSCKVSAINTHLKRFGLECPKFHNVADYLIEIACEDAIANEVIKEQMIMYQRKKCQLQEESRLGFYSEIDHRQQQEDDNISEKFINKRATTNELELEKSQKVSMLAASSNSLYDTVALARSRRERPFYRHFVVHLSRSMLRIRSSAILTYLQLVTYILLGLQLSTFYGPSIGTLSGCPKLPTSFMGFVFSDDSEQDHMNLEMRRIQENMNFLLVAIMTATFAALEITVITFPLEAKTVKREWRNGWYRVSSYFMGRTLADLPFQLVFVICFCIVVYTLTGQIGLTTWRFGSFVTIVVMVALIAQTVGFIFGALFMNNLPAAVFTAPLCIFPALLFSGFFSRVSQVPAFYLPMTYLSHFRYAFDALLVTLYGYNRCDCDQDALDAYHASLKNQTLSVKDMFQSLFGSADCGSNNNNDENSIEDSVRGLDCRTLDCSELLGVVNQTTSTTAMPRMLSHHTIKPLEDALVDSVFAHISSNQSTSAPDDTGSTSAMDHLASRFSTRVTNMLNSQSNFGHPIPVKCQEFNSYLMTEFDLHNEDLIVGLMMLFVVVVLSRLLCNVMLNYTIASRTTR